MSDVEQELVAELVSGPDVTRSVGSWTRRLIGMEANDGVALVGALNAHRGAAQWPGFVRELFGELYGLGTRPLAEAAAGGEWVAKILDIANGLPEWQELKARSEGDPWRCALGTDKAVRELAAELDDVLGDLPEKDPAEAAVDAADLEAASAADPDNARLRRAAAAARSLANVAAADAQVVADKLSDKAETVARMAMRAAAQEAHREIDDMDAALAGMGHGVGAGALTAVGAPTEAVAKALRENPSLRRIAAIAGRLRISAKKRQATKTSFGREEICDVEIGGDIQRLLPSEQVMLGDPDLEPLLLRKLMERQALQYRLRGSERAERGPIVVMMDGSGSMAGARHEWAMGVALALLEVAAMQRRSLALVHFGSSVVKHDVIANPRGLSLPKIIEMVTFFANSGTNIQACLEWVGDNLLGAEESLRGADVLLVTDGESGDFSPQVRALRDQYGACTYGIAICQHWREVNKAPLEDYHHVTDDQIRRGAENIEGVLGL